jgi:hypothetical protein
MKSKHQELLNDVLGESAPPDFKDSLWLRTLDEVRSRRRARQRNRALLACTVAIALPVLIWRLTLSPAPTELPPLPYAVIHSQPLPVGMTVESKPDTVSLVASSSATMAVIATDPARRLYREINDDQLLTLLAGRPAAIIREGPNRASLLFLEPEDQNGFPVH